MKSRMKYLITILNRAAREYYQNDNEIISNYEYDKLFDELVELETINGILSNSPTQRAGYEIISELKKVKHDSKMLSLNKTKEQSQLEKFLGDKQGLLSYKLDGITVVLKYSNGKLTSAITRGNGEVGEDITHNARVFSNLPLTIDNKEDLILRGEAIISYSEFDRINSELSDENKYKNPRNLCSGTVRQLKTEICADRNVRWIAFEAIKGFKNMEWQNSRLNAVENLGFEIVTKMRIMGKNLESVMKSFSPKSTDYPVDGLVLTYDNVEYGESLGSTSHHPKHSMAFKWKDDSQETTLRDILVDIGKSGQVSYTALFDPVEIEGTTVEKATLHNSEYIEGLELGIGDSIEVIKANMIIPQVIDNNTRSGSYNKALACPVCGGDLVHKGVHQFCTNYNCERQAIGRLAHWCSRDAMDIDGMGEETIKSIREVAAISCGFDLYCLRYLVTELEEEEGFGKKRISKMLASIEASKTKPLSNVLYGLAIPKLGRKASKLLAEEFLIVDALLSKDVTLEMIQNVIGNAVGQSVWDNLLNDEGMVATLEMLKNVGLCMTQEIEKKSDTLKNLTFVVTGKVEKFSNRKELQSKIESLGGKVSGTVSKNTNYLINNDTTSTTGKNKKAQDIGVQIISEEDFMDMIK